jgi:hypothetical protein
MFPAGRGTTKTKTKTEIFTQFCCMARKRKPCLAAAACAHQVRHFQETSNSNDPEAKITILIHPPIVLEITSDTEGHWTGGVNHTLLSDSEFYWTDGESDGSTSDSQEFSEVEDEVFLQSLKENLAEKLEMLAVPTPYQEVLQKLTMKDWKKGESNCGLGYSGNSERTKQQEAQEGTHKSCSRCSPAKNVRADHSEHRTMLTMNLISGRVL